MKTIKLSRFSLALLTILLLFSGCSYKFSGASIPADMKTIRIPLFENTATLVYPSLANTLTEELRNKIRTQTKLSITEKEADGSFEGRITEYDIKPIAIQDNAKPVAGANRLTITVAVKYTNRVKDSEKQSFDQQSFSAYTDFSLASRPLAAQQEELNKKVIEQLIENIFNRAFAQW